MTPFRYFMNHRTKYPMNYDLCNTIFFSAYFFFENMSVFLYFIHVTMWHYVNILRKITRDLFQNEISKTGKLHIIDIYYWDHFNG